VAAEGSVVDRHQANVRSAGLRPRTRRVATGPAQPDSASKKTSPVGRHSPSTMSYGTTVFPM
jgi:hypothetical protein